VWCGCCSAVVLVCRVLVVLLAVIELIGTARDEARCKVRFRKLTFAVVAISSSFVL
jgi:hypothetical protein